MEESDEHGSSGQPHPSLFIGKTVFKPPRLWPKAQFVNGSISNTNNASKVFTIAGNLLQIYSVNDNIEMMAY